MCVGRLFDGKSEKSLYLGGLTEWLWMQGGMKKLLRIEIESLQGDGFDIGFTGFDENELADLFGTDDTSDIKDVGPLHRLAPNVRFLEEKSTVRSTTLY